MSVLDSGPDRMVAEPVTLINPVTVPRAETEQFFRHWRYSAEIMAAQPGFARARLYRALDDAAGMRFVNVAQRDRPTAYGQEYVDPLKDPRGHFIHSLYKPLIGLFLGLPSFPSHRHRPTLIEQSGVGIGVFGLGADVMETAVPIRESGHRLVRAPHREISRVPRVRAVHSMILIRPRTRSQSAGRRGRNTTAITSPIGGSVSYEFDHNAE